MTSDSGQTRRTMIASAGAGVFLASFGAAGAADAQAAGTVATKQGQVRGFTRNGVQMFLGIRYGGNTAGANRFMPPTPAPKISGVFDATKIGQRAPQAATPLYRDPFIGEYMAGGRARELIAMQEPMGEDCLVLNVLTPAADNKKRAVLFYLHGGGYTSGSGAVHTLGDRFVQEQDVVLVTLNHRLGAFGFTYLGGLSPKYAKGNVGMLDAVQALTWVRDNIAKFGGDPAKVTIQGESGGGGKVASLMSMPLAKGLFRHAIIQSAGAPNPTPKETATNTARELLTKFKVSNPDDLQNVPMADFIGGGGPVADGLTIPDRPWPDAAPVTAANMPLLIGYCAHEATWLTGMRDTWLFAAEWSDVPGRLARQLNKPEAAITPIIAAYREAYPNRNAPDTMFRMMSVATTGRNIRRMADLQTKQSPGVYLYRIEYDVRITPGLRAFHTCELPLIMRMVAQPDAEDVSKKLATSWANFVKTGDPNGAGAAPWAKHSAGASPAIFFDRQTTSGSDPETKAAGMMIQLMTT